MQLRVLPSVPATRPPFRIVHPSTHAEPRAEISNLVYAVAIAGAVATGFIVRLSFVLTSNFPLHDGGLFYRMVLDLHRNHYILPPFTSYNDAQIPFAYPPLGLYAAGFLADATHLSLINVFRFLPLVVNTATIVAFFLLARNLLSSRIAVTTSVFVFAMLPRTFLWMIMGGGITRSLGFLFAILTIWQVHLLYTRRKAVFVLPASILAACAILSHIEMGWFAAFSAIVLFVAYGRHPHGVLSSLSVAAISALLAAPWWVIVVARHGAGIFLAAGQASAPSESNPLVNILSFRFTNEPLFTLIGALALLGVIVCLARRKYLLPVWLIVVLVLDPRAFGTAASVQMALLSGIAISDIIVPLTSCVGDHASPLSRAVAEPAARRGAPNWLAPATVIFILAYTTLAAFVSGPRLLTAATTDERTAMRWVAQHTPASSRFAIITGDAWFTDRTNEWFPALAERASVATPQGYEWLPPGAFRRQVERYKALQKCSDRNADCLAAWSAEQGAAYGYIYIPKLAPRNYETADPDECCAALRAALRSDTHYSVVYDGPGATIFQLRSAPGT